eukprot:992534-Amphidinium_carterae.1
MPWLVNAHAVLPEVGSVDPAINVWPITNGSCIIKAAEAALTNINHASIGAIALQVQVKQFTSTNRGSNPTCLLQMATLVKKSCQLFFLQCQKTCALKTDI